MRVRRVETIQRRPKLVVESPWFACGSAARANGTNAVDATVSIYTNGAVAQGSAPSGGTAFPIASTVSVPADASLIVVDKTTGLYLEEGVSLTITSGTASKLTFSVSYEIMA